MKNKNPLAEVQKFEDADSTEIKGADPDYDYRHVRADKIVQGRDPKRGYVVCSKEEVSMPYAQNIADGDFNQQMDTIVCKRHKSIGEKLREKREVKKEHIRKILSRGQQSQEEIEKGGLPFYLKGSTLE
ncbi:MAG: hypothetical protein DDT22_00954 [candidate division WS2 bacterium]|nr:hypothetical protein [Candidatus Lithacetigena glycinireducens]